MAECCMEVHHTQLWVIAISQGSVATRLGCGRIFNYYFA